MHVVVVNRTHQKAHTLSRKESGVAQVLKNRTSPLVTLYRLNINLVLLTKSVRQRLATALRTVQVLKNHTNPLASLDQLTKSILQRLVTGQLKGQTLLRLTRSIPLT